LQLANNGNVQIDNKTPQGEISNQSIHLKVLSNHESMHQFAGLAAHAPMLTA
jgi:hypothetical protein